MNKEADVIEQIKEKVYLSNYNFPHKLKMFWTAEDVVIQ